MTSPIDAPKALTYRSLFDTNPLNRLVSKIFTIKIADTSTDNKGHLKLAGARANKPKQTSGGEWFLRRYRFVCPCIPNA